MKRIFKVFIIGILFSLTSCETAKNIVNDYYPPLNTVDQQIAAIEQNLELIDSITPDIGIYIDRQVLDKYLPKEIKKLAENSSNEDIEIRKFDPKLSFKKQAIQINANYSFYLQEYDVLINGNLLGMSSISTVRDTLYIRNAFKTFKIKKIKFENKPTLKEKALAIVIKQIFDNFITNINGELYKKPQSIYIGWEKSLQFNPKSLFSGQTVQITSSTKVIDRYLKHSSMLVDTQGISIVIEVDEKKTLNNETPTSNVIKKIELEKLFNIYKNKFNNKWNSSFDKINGKTGITLLIKKSVLANIFNDALSENFELVDKFQNKKEKFSSKIEVENSKIDCQKLRESFHYKRYKRKSCDWSCLRTITIGICPFCKEVKVDDPVCLAARAACNTKEEAKVAADNLKYETEKAAHNIIQESKVAACDVKREANNFLALGKFSGYTLGSGVINLNFKRFFFSEDLSSIDISYSGKVNYKLNSKLNIQPMDLGYIFLCQFNYNKTTSSKISAKLKQQTTTFSIKTKIVEGTLILTMEPKPINYKAQINPSPLHEMLKDFRFLGSCPVFYSFLGMSSISAAVANFTGNIKLSPEVELLLMGNVKGEYKLDKIESRIKPIVFEIMNEKEMKAKIYWGNKSIIFTSN